MQVPHSNKDMEQLEKIEKVRFPTMVNISGKPCKL